MTDINTANDFLVGVHGDDLVLGFPIPGRLSKDQACRLAAWLVVLADPLDETFPAVRRAIENT